MQRKSNDTKAEGVPPPKNYQVRLPPSYSHTPALEAIDILQSRREHATGDAPFWILTSAMAHLNGYNLDDGEGSTVAHYFPEPKFKAGDIVTHQSIGFWSESCVIESINDTDFPDDPVAFFVEGGFWRTSRLVLATPEQPK